MSSRSHSSPRVPILAVLGLVIAVSLCVSCVPEERGETRELDRQSSSDNAKPPEFPESNVPKALLVEGLIYDFTARPADQDYWAMSEAQAKCAANAIVEAVGQQRLSDLGYRVDTPGASLNDLELTAKERSSVVTGFEDCVDLSEAMAAVVFGKGRVSGRAASCVAGILDDRDQLRPFVEAWALGDSVSPFAVNASLASVLSSAAQVCIDPNEFQFPRLRMPGEVDIPIDVNAPAGSAASAHPDDRPREDVTTTSVAGG